MSFAMSVFGFVLFLCLSRIGMCLSAASRSSGYCYLQYFWGNNCSDIPTYAKGFATGLCMKSGGAANSTIGASYQFSSFMLTSGMFCMTSPHESLLS
jgi:hypothetical protein